MTYYFLSSDSSRLGDFQKRMPVLSEAVVISSFEALENDLKLIPRNAFFFVPIQGLDQSVKKQILLIKDEVPTAKIIYITDTDSAHDLKAHQLSPFGGDAYIHHGTRTMDLKDILESLKSAEEAPVPSLADVTSTKIPLTQNRLELPVEVEFSDFSELDEMRAHPVSNSIDQKFKTVIKEKSEVPQWQSSSALAQEIPKDENGEPMSTKDKELALDDVGELEINLGDDSIPESIPHDDGLELSLSEEEALDLGDADLVEEDADSEAYGELSLGEEEEESFSLSDDSNDEVMENIGELSFEDEVTPELPVAEEALDLSDLELGGEGGLDLSGDLSEDVGLSLSDDLPDLAEDDGLSLSLDDALSLDAGLEGDLSDDAKEKLKEIDAIMDFDASQVSIQNTLKSDDEAESLDEPLVSDDLNLDSLNFGSDEIEEVSVAAPKEEKPKKAKKVKETKERDLGEDLKEISGAYSGEMERMQATISNLRSDREELLAKIQKLEEDKVLHGRQTLTMRAELDEKKIELTIIRKKLNEEVNELKDRLKLFDEKRLILEEKNRILTQELDKAAQKNKIDVKKVQMRERELEQRLELLKADAETQIRNRDLKILELKRKIDAMEFDMESISTQEKRSVESRYELEDKLEKAIKTLRSAITVLEDESDRNNALEALKKNIDM